MNIETFWEWLQNTPLALVISERYFPLVESIHVIAIAFVFGSIALVDLRLLGLSAKRLSITYVSNQLLPWVWRGFILAAITGTLMFIGNANHYYSNVPFRWKVLFLVLLAVNMLVFQKGTFRNVSAWDTGPPAPGARVAGAISLLLWAGVITTGRWIGFV
jgi:hypothetical protein